MQGGGGIFLLLTLLYLCQGWTLEEGNKEPVERDRKLDIKQVHGLDNRIQANNKSQSGLLGSFLRGFIRNGLLKSGIFGEILGRMKIRHKGERLADGVRIQ